MTARERYQLPFSFTDLEDRLLRAYVWGAWRPVRSIREIRRGRNRGKFEISCLYNPGAVRKAVVAEHDLREVPEGTYAQSNGPATPARR
jgi:hypothetical protein